MDEVNSFSISQILGPLRVSGMGHNAQKCEKLPMSLHPNDNFQLTLINPARQYSITVTAPLY